MIDWPVNIDGFYTRNSFRYCLLWFMDQLLDPFEEKDIRFYARVQRKYGKALELRMLNDSIVINTVLLADINMDIKTLKMHSRRKMHFFI